MPPGSLVALAIVIVAVIPGSTYTWAYEREASAFGVTLADRSLRFIAISLLFGSFGKSLGYPVYIPAAQIARMEIVRPLNGVKEATNA